MGRRPQHTEGKPAGYDPTLELLATLTPVDVESCISKTPLADRPDGTPMRLLIQSFGHEKKDHPIRKLITETQVRHKVQIVTFLNAEGTAVGIARQSYARARMLTEDYWDRVYGEEGEAA